MTYTEAARIIEQIIDDTHDLTYEACCALMMGVDALREKGGTEDDGK